jgi:hypothetical protein
MYNGNDFFSRTSSPISLKDYPYYALKKGLWYLFLILKLNLIYLKPQLKEHLY